MVKTHMEIKVLYRSSQVFGSLYLISMVIAFLRLLKNLLNMLERCLDKVLKICTCVLIAESLKSRGGQADSSHLHLVNGNLRTVMSSL